MVDMDGTFRYSPVITVYKGAAEAFTVFPNPASQQLNVCITTGSTPRKHTLKVWDMDGRLVKTIQVLASRGTNLFNFSISALNAGHYVLQDGDNISLFAKK